MAEIEATTGGTLALALPFIAAALAPILRRLMGAHAAWILALAPALAFALLFGFVPTVSAGGVCANAREPKMQTRRRVALTPGIFLPLGLVLGCMNLQRVIGKQSPDRSLTVAARKALGEPGRIKTVPPRH